MIIRVGQEGKSITKTKLLFIDIENRKVKFERDKEVDTQIDTTDPKIKTQGIDNLYINGNLVHDFSNPYQFSINTEYLKSLPLKVNFPKLYKILEKPNSEFYILLDAKNYNVIKLFELYELFSDGTVNIYQGTEIPVELSVDSQSHIVNGLEEFNKYFDYEKIEKIY